MLEINFTSISVFPTDLVSFSLNILPCETQNLFGLPDQAGPKFAEYLQSIQWTTAILQVIVVLCLVSGGNRH